MITVFTVCYFICIFLTKYPKVWSVCFNFRQITAKLSGVQKFRNFTVFQEIMAFHFIQELALAVLQNKLGAYCRHLTVREGEDLRLQGVQGILVHFLSVLQQLEGANTLMQPLIGLMRQPQQYAVGSFLAH